LSDLTLILLSAGSSSRFDMPVKKQWLRIDTEPLWQFVTSRFTKSYNFDQIIITASADEIEYMKLFTDYTLVVGGRTRQASLQNALKSVKTPYVLVSDIARCCVNDDLIERLINSKESADSIVPFINISDTVTQDGVTIERESLKRIQTPQLSRTEVLNSALKSNVQYTDESSAIIANGGSREFIQGDSQAHKLTYKQDLEHIKCLNAPENVNLCGTGFDVHEFEVGKQMLLGGIRIDADYGFKAHSDGDVAIHSIIDALLGASAMGDIGTLFPDSDEQYKNIDSKILLDKTVKLIKERGFEIINTDITILAQAPRLEQYKDKIRNSLASLLGIAKHRVNVKATTTEKLGFIGRKEGVGVQSIVTLKYFDWTK